MGFFLTKIKKANNFVIYIMMCAVSILYVATLSSLKMKSDFVIKYYTQMKATFLFIFCLFYVLPITFIK